MQLAMMPVTPLGRRMHCFGWSETQAAPAAPAVHLPGEVVEPTVSPGTVLPHLGSSSASFSSAPSQPPATSSFHPSAASGVAKYESRDVHGRVWGVPNAGGRGQCLDCPKQALLPSMRCADCQLRLSRGTPMADLDRFRQKLNRAAAKCVNREVALRLDALYQKLQTGQIPDSVQEKLRSFADAVTAAPRRSVEAQKIIQLTWVLTIHGSGSGDSLERSVWEHRLGLDFPILAATQVLADWTEVAAGCLTLTALNAQGVASGREILPTVTPCTVGVLSRGPLKAK
eukprot:s340_g29.t1